MMIFTKTVLNEIQKSQPLDLQRSEPLMFQTSLEKPFQSLVAFKQLIKQDIKPQCPASQACCSAV